MSKSLSGIFAPITTPFENEEVSYRRLKENVQKYAQTPLRGLFVIGSNGEAKRLTDEALIAYYKDVAEAVPVPVLIYNAPGFTGITVSPKVVEALSKHPNIAGMKDTSPGNIASYLDVCGDDFSVLAGTINFLFIGLSIGAQGGVLSLANAFP